jgi:threonine synthase
MQNAETASLAIGQRSLGDPRIRYPLWPPLSNGCPETSTPEVQYPLEVEYSPLADAGLFEQPPLPGIEHWAPLLPPLAERLGLGEGGTPLVDSPQLADWVGFDGPLFIKDESRNPTWSHKDRLNRCTVSAALHVDAPGVVAASPGNQGSSAAAYCAAADLPCLIIATSGGPPAVESQLLAYGATVVAVAREARWPLMRRVVAELGFHPVTNLTETHTGHPFGAEGYKTIAYELFLQLGKRAPAAVFVPTGYGELLFGIWKGFSELQALHAVDRVPAMIACEPEVRAPLTKALAESLPAASVPAAPTDAYSIACTVSGYRGVVAVRDSHGTAIPLSNQGLAEAHARMRQAGLWHELSSAASLAGLRRALASGMHFPGPVVCISTASGFKNVDVGREKIVESPSDWPSFRRTLKQLGLPT